MTRVAVIGHVEWVDFVGVPRYPQRGGLVQGQRLFEHAGGGAVVAATVLARLGAEVDFFCALADDGRGHAAHDELTARGIAVHAAWRPPPTRYVFTALDAGGERTIVTVGERTAPAGADELPWARLADADAAYFTAGDARALAHSRRAAALVVTPRAGDLAAGLRDVDRHDVDRHDIQRVDATVFSAGDADEARWARDWEDHSRLMVATESADGGRWWGTSDGRWPAAPVPGAIRDSYGCGDAFAAGFTFGLGAGEPVAGAAAAGARCGAEMLTRVGGP